MARAKSTTSSSLTYAELQKQIEALQAQAGQARVQEVAQVVARIREAIKVYQLTPADLFSERGDRKAKAAKPRPASATVAKYRDPVSGKTWNGNGRRPGWYLAAIEGGASPESLAV